MTEIPDAQAPTVRYSRRALEVKKTATLVDAVLAIVLMALGLLLRLWGVGQPDKMYFDEIYYVDAADKLWAGKPDPNSVHPPLGKWMIALGVHAGDELLPKKTPQPVKWRMASVVAGTLCVGLTYALSLLVFNYNRPAAALAGLIMATEHLAVSISRIAMLDPFLALFCLIGIYGALRYFLGGHERWSVLSAFSLGLATGCKWSGLFTAFGCLAAGYWLNRRAVSQEKTVRYFFWLALLIPLGFLLCYLHLFLADGVNLAAFKKILGQGDRMVQFRKDSSQFTHRYLSHFWSWPLMITPIWLFFEENKDTQTIRAICAMGTPLFWWGFLVLLFERAYSAFRLKNKETGGPLDPIAGALVILWFCQWIPWCVSYTGGFFYYMLTEIPIMALLVGKLIADLLNLEDALGEGRWRGWLLLGLYGLSFVVYLPYATCKPTSRSYFNKVFFSHWITGHPEATKKPGTKTM